MISSRISVPRYNSQKLPKIPYSARKSINFQKVNENNYSNDDQQTTFALEKLDLVNEIKQIKKDIEANSKVLRKKERIYNKKMDKALKDPYNRTLNSEDKKEVEQFNQNAGKVQMLQSNIEELDTQIRFFKSLFSEDSLTKIQDEVQAQKRIHSDLLADIQSLTEDNELLLCDIEGQCLAEKIQRMMEYKSLEKKHKDEVKGLKKEGRKLMKEAEEMQKNDPIDKNKKEVVLLRNQLMKLQRRRSIKERDSNENSKRKEVQMAISKDVHNDIRQEKIREKKEKQKLKEIKETTDFQSHTMMPIETFSRAPRNKKKNIKQDEGDTKLFEITQQQDNYKEEEEERNDQLNENMAYEDQ